VALPSKTTTVAAWAAPTARARNTPSVIAMIARLVAILPLTLLPVCAYSCPGEIPFADRREHSFRLRSQSSLQELDSNGVLNE
jgi:hypothetical protein